MCVRQMRPPVGGLLDSENCFCPLSQKPVQKWFCPERGSLSVKGVFEKKFQVRERIPLSALAFRYRLDSEQFSYPKDLPRGQW
jgi:hypothetical protein